MIFEKEPPKSDAKVELAGVVLGESLQRLEAYSQEHDSDFALKIYDEGYGIFEKDGELLEKLPHKEKLIWCEEIETLYPKAWLTWVQHNQVELSGEELNVARQFLEVAIATAERRRELLRSLPQDKGLEYLDRTAYYAAMSDFSDQHNKLVSRLKTEFGEEATEKIARVYLGFIEELKKFIYHKKQEYEARYPNQNSIKDAYHYINSGAVGFVDWGSIWRRYESKK